MYIIFTKIHIPYNFNIIDFAIIIIIIMSVNENNLCDIILIFVCYMSVDNQF